MLAGSKAHSAILEAIDKIDLFRLITLYHDNPDDRETIRSACKQNGHYGQVLCNKMLFYYTTYLENERSLSWDKFLSQLPAIEDVSDDTVLHQAIRKNDIEYAKANITEETDFYKCNKRGFNLVHLAFAFNRIEIVDHILPILYKKHEYWYLFSSPVYLPLLDGNGQNLLHYLADMKTDELTQALSRWTGAGSSDYFEFWKQDQRGRTPLHLAACNPDSKVLERFLNRLNYGKYTILEICQRADSAGMTPLHYAVCQGLVENVKLLLAKKVDNSLQVVDFDHSAPLIPKGTTPLSLAITGAILAVDWAPQCENAYFEIIDLLIKDKSDLDLRDVSNKMSAVQLVMRRERTDWLEKWRVRFDRVYDIYEKYIPDVIQTGSLKTFGYLQEKYRITRYRDRVGNSSLHIAACHDQTRIVTYICEAYEKEQFRYRDLIITDSTFMRKVGDFQQTLWRLDGLIDLNAENHCGETPYMVAICNDSVLSAQALKEYGANTDTVFQYIYKAIYYPPAAKANELGYPPFTMIEERIAVFSSRYARMIARHTDMLGNTFIHHCVLTRQYRLMRVLLHSLSQEDREIFCQKRNLNNETPFDCLKQLRASAELKEAEKAQIDKIERLLVRYDPNEMKLIELIDDQEYYFNWGRDEKEEIMRSDGYKTASKVAYVAIPFVKAAYGYFQIHGYPWFFMTEFLQSYIGNDPVLAMEKLLNFTMDYLPEKMKTPAKYMQTALWWYGMYSNTMMRACLEVTRHLTASVLPRYIENDNYITHKNHLGVIMAVNEEFVRYFSSTFSDATDCHSIEESLHSSVGVPRVRDLAAAGLDVANNSVEFLTGVNVRKTSYQAYLWARENIGQVPPPVQVFNEKYLSNLKKEWGCEDPELEAQYVTVAKALFDDSYDYGYAVLTKNQFDVLAYYAKTGVFSEEVSVIFARAGMLMAENGEDASSVLYQLLSKSALARSMNVSEKEAKNIYRELEQSLDLLTYANAEKLPNALRGIVLKAHSNLISKHIENEKVKIRERYSKNENLSAELILLINALQQSSREDIYLCLFKVNVLLSFAMMGDILGSQELFTGIFDKSSMNMPDVLSELYMSSQAYQIYNFDESMSKTHHKFVRDMIEKGIKEGKSIAEIFKSVSDGLTEEFVTHKLPTLLQIEEGNYDENFTKLFQDLSRPILQANWNDYIAKRDFIDGMIGFLSCSGTLERQSLYLAKIAESAKANGHNVAEVVEMFFKNSGLVRQFGSDRDFVDSQAAILTADLLMLNDPNSDVKASEVLNRAMSAIIENYVDKTFMGELIGETIEDPELRRAVETAVIAGAKSSIEDLSKLNEYFNETWQIIHNSQVTTENVDTLEVLSAQIVAQGGDSDEMIAYLLTHSKGYTSVHFSETVTKSHQADLRKAIQSCREQGKPLSSIFDGTFYKEGLPYLYPLSKKGMQAFIDAHPNVLLREIDKIGYDEAATWIVNMAVDSNSGKPNERNNVARDVAGQIVKYFFPCYPDIKPPEWVEYEQSLYSEISENQLTGYDRDHDNAKNNVKYFIVSQITGKPQTVYKKGEHWYDELVKKFPKEVAKKILGPGFSMFLGVDDEGKFNGTAGSNSITIPIYNSGKQGKSKPDFYMGPPAYLSPTLPNDVVGRTHVPIHAGHSVYSNPIMYPYGVPQSVFEVSDYYAPAFQAAQKNFDASSSENYVQDSSNHTPQENAPAYQAFEKGKDDLPDERLDYPVYDDTLRLLYNFESSSKLKASKLKENQSTEISRSKRRSLGH